MEAVSEAAQHYPSHYAKTKKHCCISDPLQLNKLSLESIDFIVVDNLAGFKGVENVPENKCSCSDAYYDVCNTAVLLEILQL